jgi:hypothetical protein
MEKQADQWFEMSTVLTASDVQHVECFNFSEWNNNQSAYKKCSSKVATRRFIRLYAHSILVQSANTSLPVEWGYKWVLQIFKYHY